MLSSGSGVGRGWVEAHKVKVGWYTYQYESTSLGHRVRYPSKGYRRWDKIAARMGPMSKK